MSQPSSPTSVITGAAGGIGASLARRLAGQGHRIAAVDLSLERAQALATSLGSGARGYGCDVSDAAQVEALAAQVLADFDGIHMLFANAGVAIGGKLTETSGDEFRWLFDVNVLGAFQIIRAFIPALIEQGRAGASARVVLTGSENALGLPETAEMTAYTATKHAILAMADGLRRDLAGTGVEVHVFCPGVVATRIWDGRAYRQQRYGGAAPASAEMAEKF